MMEAWHIWIIIALILLIIEVLTSGFAIICFSIGAFCGALTASLGGSLTIQLLVFAVISIFCALVLRPIFIKYLARKKNGATNAEAMVGLTATVTETVGDNGGRISVYGESWKAVSETGETIPAGSKVVITKIDSLTITVKIP